MTKSTLPIVALTMGDVAGIGPEVIAQALVANQRSPFCRPVVIGHPQILQESLQQVGYGKIAVFSCDESLLGDALETANKIICINPIGDEVLQAPKRKVSPQAGEGAYQYLLSGIRLVSSGQVQAIATAPLNKAALHQAGRDFPGHTEILAHECGIQKFAMMLHLPEEALQVIRPIVQTFSESKLPEFQANNGLSIVHVTLHTSVESVPQLLKTADIQACIGLMHDFLSAIGCRRRQIGVAALNPHGGEGGLFGDEEARCIAPAVQLSSWANVTGPLPVDTLVRRSFAGEFDGLVAMYHDQGHIPVKLLGFDDAINITLGLPIIRTSPTHGTAFDKAWQTNSGVNPQGMIAAIKMAARLASNQARSQGNGMTESISD